MPARNSTRQRPNITQLPTRPSAGGPGTQTTVPSVLVYQNAFVNGKVGLAAAVAVVLTALIFVVAFGITRIVDRDPSR